MCTSYRQPFIMWPIIPRGDRSDSFSNDIVFGYVDVDVALNSFLKWWPCLYYDNVADLTTIPFMSTIREVLPVNRVEQRINVVKIIDAFVRDASVRQTRQNARCSASLLMWTVFANVTLNGVSWCLHPEFDMPIQYIVIITWLYYFVRYPFFC